MFEEGAAADMIMCASSIVILSDRASADGFLRKVRALGRPSLRESVWSDGVSDSLV